MFRRISSINYSVACNEAKIYCAACQTFILGREAKQKKIFFQKKEVTCILTVLSSLRLHYIMQCCEGTQAFYSYV